LATSALPRETDLSVWLSNVSFWGDFGSRVPEPSGPFLTHLGHQPMQLRTRAERKAAPANPARRS